MDITGRSVVLLGGSGLVGMAVARRILPHRPARLVIASLMQTEAETAVEELRAEGAAGAGGATGPDGADGVELVAEWGDLFVPETLKDRPRREVLEDHEARVALLDDLYGELTPDVVARSSLGRLVARHRPDIVVDCVNTATAFAYQNVFQSAQSLRTAAEGSGADRDTVERHLTTLYLPQLIRHVQIVLESLREAGTSLYLKIGTSGTGGMGLNIPFTHSEERPSRMLLSKAGLAGAHTLLLYLMARTPDAPVVKEIKPTAAISWKRIAYGEVRRGGRALERWDAVEPVSLEDAFGDFASDDVAARACRRLEGSIRGVYLDAGENGLFSLGEFEVLTALGLMEFITPEEIADNVLREVRGHPTGRDVVAALDAATSGPTYRAGVLRQVAVEEMEALERQHGVSAVAYEMLGPPRLSKLLFEAAILERFYDDVVSASELEPESMAEGAANLVDGDDDLRVRILSTGLPILLPDGERMLRGRDLKVAPEAGQSPRDPRLAENGWVDLRASNWARWKERLTRMAAEGRELPGPEMGSRADVESGRRRLALRPGRLAAWVFRSEDGGERLKR